MNYKKLNSDITAWIKSYTEKNHMSTLVVGISGGIDSAVVSTLCAKTNINTIVVSMPIKQIESQNNLSINHGLWLTKKYNNVKHEIIDMTNIFSEIEEKFENINYSSLHALANTRSRLRMLGLYQIAGSNNGLVVGTGNKIEDFGIGFFTKYGDGGVDISPIGDCMKSDVWEMAKELNINQKIIEAPPTDGLWDDGRTDEDQLKGLNYEQLENAMKLDELKNSTNTYTESELELLEKYTKIRNPNLHKMFEIPVFKLKK